MDIRILKYFITITEEGSITKAAKRLNMAQPPLSTQMMQLEEELGVCLFIRGKKHIQLTEAGIFLKSRAEEILSSFELLERQMCDYKEGNRGRVTIGAVEAVATHYLPEVLTGFRENYRDITYEIWSGSTDDILYRLNKGMIDVGFLRSESASVNYNSIRLREDSWGIIMPKNHGLAGKEIKTVTPEMLREELLIVPSSGGRMAELTEWFNRAGVQPNISCSYNTLAIGEAMVSAGMGLLLVLVDYTEENLKEGMICKKISPALRSSVSVLWSQSHYLSDAASRLIDYIRTVNHT